MNKMPDFLSYVLRRWSACSSSVLQYRGYHFYRLEAGELGLASVAVTWPLVMMFGAVGDMLGTGAAIIIAQSRGSGNPRLARLSLGNMLVWQVLFSLLMMTVVKCFLTDILRLFGATDELMPGAVRYSRILIYGDLAYMLVTGVLAVIP